MNLRDDSDIRIKATDTGWYVDYDTGKQFFCNVPNMIEFVIGLVMDDVENIPIDWDKVSVYPNTTCGYTVERKEE